MAVTDSAASPHTAVYLELGRSRVFACAADWPGWCRSGRDKVTAIDALTVYRARYASVAGTAGAAGAGFPAPPQPPGFRVVERVAGTSTTDFGAPAVVPQLDAGPLTDAAGCRLAALVAAAWQALDRAAAVAPAALRRGPRGGGRDRDALVAHVRQAEAGYAGKLGLPGRRGDDEGLRPALLAVLAAPGCYDPRARGPRGGRRWPLRYAARRVAWHALEHAWEIEDRSS